MLVNHHQTVVVQDILWEISRSPTGRHLRHLAHELAAMVSWSGCLDLFWDSDVVCHQYQYKLDDRSFRV